MNKLIIYFNYIILYLKRLSIQKNLKKYKIFWDFLSSCSLNIIRFHKHYQPEGTNVNFVKADKENNTLFVRTYERGVEGETLACGTGVVASSIISVILNKVKSPVHVITKGKDNLYVSCSIYNNKISNVFLEGPAIVAFTGTVKIDL